MESSLARTPMLEVENLKVGSFRKNGQNRQASRSGVRVA
jgi:hypothetical protein